MIRRVGVFDSGIGGLTVVRAVRERHPNADVLYLGDTARLPYGNKSPATVEKYSLACQQFLLDRGAELILAACNTASANAVEALRRHCNVPVIDAVRAGAEAAVSVTQNGHVGVLGTRTTCASGAYPKILASLRSGLVVETQPSPLLVPLAEEGWQSGNVVQEVAAKYLRNLLATLPEIDTLVLGCTHYPVLQDVLEETVCRLAGRAVRVVDSASAMALAMDTYGPFHGDGAMKLFATDATRLEELATLFLGDAASEFELVDL